MHWPYNQFKHLMSEVNVLLNGHVLDLQTKGTGFESSFDQCCIFWEPGFKPFAALFAYV